MRAVVDLPTPPFWLLIAMVRHIKVYMFRIERETLGVNVDKWRGGKAVRRRAVLPA